MIKTFLTSYKLKSTYRANGVIYSFKQIPFIKKILPDALYKSEALKIIAHIICVFFELSTFFVTKPLYIFTMIFITSQAYENNASNAFITIFVMLTLVGGVLNSHFFDPTKDKFYAINLMRMDAKKYALTNYAYFLSKIIIGMLPAMVLFGLLAGVKLYVCLLMPLFVVFVKIIYAAMLVKKIDKTNLPFNENKPTITRIIFVIVGIAGAYLLPANAIEINHILFLILFVITLLLAIPCGLYLIKFSRYNIIYKSLLVQENVIIDTKSYVSQTQKESMQKQIQNQQQIQSSKQGYGYFHDVFMSRHKKLLMRSSIITALIALVVFVGIIVSIVIFPEFAQEFNNVPLSFLPYFVFVMYFINRGQVITQAMFMNCDHSMLSYRFYRQPKAIVDLFTRRLVSLIKINLLPAIVISIGLPLSLYFSGGTDNNINYLILFVTIIAMSVFFSVHHLVIYYLLQPYNSQLEAKGIMYNIITGATYFIAFFSINIELPTMAFGLFMIGFTVLYVIIALLLAYKYAPKTFKLR